jgi:hypothetical protein
MGFFSNRNNNRSRNQRPAEVARVTEHLALALWQAADSDGRVRYHFKIQRMGDDPSQTFSTLRPVDCLALPEVIAAAASCFSRVPKLPAELREELAALAQSIEQVVVKRKANGMDPDESANSSGVLNF